MSQNVKNDQCVLVELALKWTMNCWREIGAVISPWPRKHLAKTGRVVDPSIVQNVHLEVRSNVRFV
jgi:hypothetical protein